jgi:hypothetical protein
MLNKQFRRRSARCCGSGEHRAGGPETNFPLRLLLLPPPTGPNLTLRPTHPLRMGMRLSVESGRDRVGCVSPAGDPCGPCMPPIGIVWLQLMAEVPCCYRFISLALTELTELKSVTSTCPICDTALFAHDNTTHLARLTCLTHGHLTACPAG